MNVHHTAGQPPNISLFPSALLHLRLSLMFLSKEKSEEEEEEVEVFSDLKSTI